MGIPEQGQLVSLRNRDFIVLDVNATDPDNGDRIFHKVRLECINDDMLGEEFEVIWDPELFMWPEYEGEGK